MSLAAPLSENQVREIAETQMRSMLNERRDMFVAAALTGLLADGKYLLSEVADTAINVADLTIMLLDKRKP